SPPQPHNRSKSALPAKGMAGFTGDPSLLIWNFKAGLPVERLQMFTFPPEFDTVEIAANGTTIHVRFGGKGPAVVLVHGYGETGDMWAPMAADLARDHRVVLPDLRGLGLSAKPASGFDKKTQAGDLAGVLDELKIAKIALVTHDIGNMVGF